MENITKLKTTYTYPSKGKLVPAIEVGFYLEPRLDRFGNVLRKVNITDKFGQIHQIDYSGNSLMLSVKTGSKTNSVRRAERPDLEKYKEAFSSYLKSVDKEQKDLLENKIHLFLEELSPEAESKSNQNELELAKLEIEKLKDELKKTKKPKLQKVEAEEEKQSEK